MIAHHIHHALAQVQELQKRVLEKQRFKGYSGSARALSGVIALMGALILDCGWLPGTIWTHFCGWAAVFAVAVGMNKVAIVYWFLTDPETERDVRRLRPVLDLVPTLIAGGALTLALILRNQFDLLFGVWMVLFGLMNLAVRHAAPRPIALVGIYYMACGAACLLLPGISFQNPWPMGIVFFLGELAGGTILHYEGMPPVVFNWLIKKGDER
ncbi:MAG: hypothetical protein PHV34_06965 [Verrucomicrobiae bacterium]|nr:hypothetical protein [Verrucomicrobiae bacterium]